MTQARNETHRVEIRIFAPDGAFLRSFRSNVYAGMLVERRRQRLRENFAHTNISYSLDHHIVAESVHVVHARRCDRGRFNGKPCICGGDKLNGW